VYRRPDDGSQLQPKHVAVKKLVKTSGECEWFNTYVCDLVTPTGSLVLKLLIKYLPHPGIQTCGPQKFSVEQHGYRRFVNGARVIQILDIWCYILSVL